MRIVRFFTGVFTILAVILLATGLALGEPTALLAGIMLLWAAIVKIVITRVWRDLGTPRATRAPEGSYQ